GQLDEREQIGREPRRKKVCEPVAQVAQTPDRHQHTDYWGKEGRPEHQVSDREAVESKKYEGEVEADQLQLERHVRQSLQLFSTEYARVAPPSKRIRGAN